MMRFMAAAFVAASCSVCAASDVVHRRDSAPSLRGEITLSDAGVTVRTGEPGSGTGASHFVPWDRVRSVQMFDEPAALASYLRIAEDLWRARSRLERGDAAMAEELFERLFERYRGSTHETALVVAEGLLRCRLERHDITRAVVPALEVARLRRARVETDSYATLSPVYDARTSLCVYVPPVWIDERSAERLRNELSRYDARGDSVVAAIAGIYEASTLPWGQEIGFNLDREASRHPGVRFLRDLVTTRTAEASVRDAARARLMRDLRGFEDWAESWARYCIGSSLIEENVAARAEIGAVEMSHLPARFGQNQPYLAGLALAHLIEFLQAGGNDVAAASLRMELARRFAFHPVRRITP